MRLAFDKPFAAKMAETGTLCRCEITPTVSPGMTFSSEPTFAPSTTLIGTRADTGSNSPTSADDVTKSFS